MICRNLYRICTKISDDTSTVDGAGSGDTDIINGTESGDENPPAARNGLMTAVNVGGEPDEIS